MRLDQYISLTERLTWELTVFIVSWLSYIRNQQAIAMNYRSRQSRRLRGAKPLGRSKNNNQHTAWRELWQAAGCGGSDPGASAAHDWLNGSGMLGAILARVIGSAWRHLAPFSSACRGPPGTPLRIPASAGKYSVRRRR